MSQRDLCSLIKYQVILAREQLWIPGSEHACDDIFVIPREHAGDRHHFEPPSALVKLMTFMGLGRIHPEGAAGVLPILIGSPHCQGAHPPQELVHLAGPLLSPAPHLPPPGQV
nr:unnamed protein product [Salmo salar]|eukprot:XP_014072185.1 PREDICTED: uncharacterized protein LOC106613427 isoform X4 [Salmo salar]